MKILANEISDVGIDAIEFYFPKNYVDQEDLEKFGNISTGKYTIGLGQKEMGFCSESEDIVSISLTVTENLLKNFEIPTDSIGCLVVGTETLIDKSKSVKTALMDLFGDNHDIEGVDIKNACFGGAQALLHAIDWVTVNSKFENRHAIVVLADIAVYEEGPARCTGGAGAMAFLIKPNAAIPIDRMFTSCYMKNSWDFYKPITPTVSEYPKVDGTLSLISYLSSVKFAYSTFKQKVKKLTNKEINTSSFDAIFLHSPFTKMVQKGLAVMKNSDSKNSEEYDENNRQELAKMVEASKEEWTLKTDPYLIFNRRIGNMYTPSLFAQLLAFLASENCPSETAPVKNILFFAYGSGLASAVFSAKVYKKESLEKMRQVALTAVKRLEQRKRFSATEFTNILTKREKLLTATMPVEHCLNKNDEYFQGTYFLKKIDEFYRRSYELFDNVHQNGVCH